MASVERAFSGQEPEGKQQGRKSYLVQLKELISGTKDELEDAALGYTRRGIELEKFISEALDILVPSHAQASFIGRHLAGAEGPLSLDDIRFGTGIAEEQVEFLEQFALDILQRPVYSEAQIVQRIKLYASRLYGTANESWALAMPEDFMVYWMLGPSEDHCEDCPAIADNGLQLLSELPTLPGMGATQCRTNCQCYLQSEDGSYGPFLVEGV